MGHWENNIMYTQMVKNLPSVQESRVQSLGQEDPLEKGMANPTVFLPGIPWKDHGLAKSQTLVSDRRKVMTNLDSLFKSRDITLPTKVRLFKAMFFPVVMYGCESWTVKKAEHQKWMLLNYGVGEDS